MKKLLLYLMALLAFGAMSVDAFATKYLYFATEKSGWEVTEVEYTGYYVQIQKAAIGNGKFAVGLYDDEVNKTQVTWYKIQGGSNTVAAGMSYNTPTQLAKAGTATTGFPPSSAVAQQKGLLYINGAGSGEVFIFSLDTSNMFLTLGVDYTQYSVTYRGDKGGFSQSDEKSMKLQANGAASFDFKTGINDYFDLWFTNPGGKVITYGAPTVTFDNNKVYYNDQGSDDPLKLTEPDLGIEDDGTYKLYIQDNGNWGTLYIYGHDGTNPVQFGIWPGTQVTSTEVIGGVTCKVVEMNSDYSDLKLIFNNGNGGNDNQYPDIDYSTSNGTHQFLILTGSTSDTPTSFNDPSTDAKFREAVKVSGLKPRTNYSVNVNYRTGMLEITELETLYYLRGDMYDNGWFATQFAKDKWRFHQSGSTLTGTFAIPADNYFSINVGDDDENPYNIDWSNWPSDQTQNLKYPVENAPMRYDEDKAMKSSTSATLSFTIELDEHKNPKTISIVKVADDTSDYSGYRMTTYYQPKTGKNGKPIYASHTTPFVEYNADRAAWIVLEDGRDVATPVEGVKYYGLGLGYDKFCISTQAPNGETKYYGVDPDAGAVGDGIYTGGARKFKEYASIEAAMENTFMSQNAGNVNSRYNVEWNFTTGEATIYLDEDWANSPNQMYLYILNPATELDSNGYVISDIITLDKVQEKIGNGVFMFDMTNDGLYEHIFTAGDNSPDLPQGTQFCIVGRNGKVYNIRNDESDTGEAVVIDNNWTEYSTNYRMILTGSDAQKPAKVTASNMANMDCYVRIRANFTGQTDFTNPDVISNNAYVITFTQKHFAPESFILYKNSTEGNGIEFVNNGDETFALESQDLKKGARYYIVAKFKDGDDYKYVNYGLSSEYEVKTDGEIAHEVDVVLESDKTAGFYINTDKLTISDADKTKNGARLYIQWNNGQPNFQILNDGQDAKVRVFFIDRAGWNNVGCYNYSDHGVSDDDNWAQTSDFNALWAGEKMETCQLGVIRNGVKIPDNVKVYEITLDVKVYSDGSYSRPKVIFTKLGNWTNDNDGGHYVCADNQKTANLYLVDGGIYTNASPEVNGKVEFPATEYLPRMQFNYMDGIYDQEVQSYPNEFHDTDYNVIYVDVPEFTKYVKNNWGNVAVHITYDKNGLTDDQKEFAATGIPGTHHLQYVKIGNKELLRVTLAADVIPNNTKVDVSFYPLKVLGEGQDDHKDDFECAYNGHNHNGDAMTKACTYDGNSYTGDHFLCWGTRCSLNFTDVNYADGNVYRRYRYDDKDTHTQDPVVKITDIVKPEALYIVTSSITPFSTARTKGYLDPETTVNGVTAYKLTDKAIDKTQKEKLIYRIPEVSANARFYILADLGDKEYVNYSGLQATAMYPNNPYTYHDMTEPAIYSINATDFKNVKNYEIQIHWTNSEVMVTANKIDAEFKFVELDNINSDDPDNGLLLPGHSDDCDESHMTPIFFTYAYGYDDDMDIDPANCRLAKLKIELRRDAEYEKYFTDGGANKQAEIIERTRQLDGALKGEFAGKYICVTQRSKKDASGNESPGLAYIFVKGYTASITELHIEQTESDNNFKRSGKDIKIRIYPTLESVGMTINNIQLGKEYDLKDKNGNIIDTRVMFTSDPQKGYSLTLSHENHYDQIGKDDKEDWVNFRDRLQFQTPYADNVTILWSEDPDATVATTANYRPRRAASIPTVVENPQFGQTNLIDNVYDDPYEGEKTTVVSGKKLDLNNYSIYNAPSVAIDPTGKTKTNKSMYLQLQQNGMNSPAYKVNVNRSPDIPTEVEEILGADNEAEAVYYDINGVRVNAERLEPGIYVKVQGTKSEKVYIK